MSLVSGCVCHHQQLKDHQVRCSALWDLELTAPNTFTCALQQHAGLSQSYSRVAARTKIGLVTHQHWHPQEVDMQMIHTHCTSHCWQ
jgi:hypothetical protein